MADLVSHYRGDVQRVFPSYQEVPIPRTARAQLSVRLFGDIIHSNGITAPLRSKLFSQGVPDDFKYTDGFYSYQPESKETDDAH